MEVPGAAKKSGWGKIRAARAVTKLDAMKKKVEPGTSREGVRRENMSVKEVVHNTFEDPAFSDLATFICVVINLLIIGSVVCFVSETLPQWEHLEFWFYAEWGFILCFTMELFIRLWAYPGTTKEFVLEPLNMIDLLAIVPFYLLILTGVSMTDTRFLRVVRLVRILKLGRYYAPMLLIVTTFVRSLSTLVLCLFFIVAGVIFFASILWYLERGDWNDHRGCYVRHVCSSANRGPWDEAEGCHMFTDLVCSPFQSIPVAFWWGITTMTTVGYGDTYPVTNFGRLVGSVTMVTGILCIALPTTILAVEFADKYQGFLEEQRRIEQTRMSVQFSKDELLIYNDMKRLFAVQKRLQYVLPRVEFLIAHKSVGTLSSFDEDTKVPRKDAEDLQKRSEEENECDLADAYEVAGRAGNRVKRSLKDFQETIQHFVPTFAPI